MTFIPVRVILALLGIYACALVYTARSGMSVSIVAMTTVEDSDSYSTNNSTHECDVTRDYRFTKSHFQSHSKESKTPEFDWNEKLKGTILGSQFYLYIIIPTFAGRITDIFGAKWVAFVGTLIPCLLSAITPVATRAGGAGVLIAIRTVMGGFHGCIYAAMFSLYIKWFPVRERVNANAGLVFGGTVGSGLMYLLGGWLCKTDIGWPLVFYVNCLLYLPWMALWLYYCTNDPLYNKRISDKELKYIQSHVPPMPAKKRSVPWSKIVTSYVVLSSVVSKMLAGFGYFLIVTEMPSYLSNVFNTPIFTNGLINCITILCHGTFGLLAAPLSNWIIKRFHIRIVIIRKAFQTVAMIGPAVCLGIIPLLGCNYAPVVVLLIGSMLLYGVYTGGEWTIISEYAPNSAGAVFGFTNTLCFAQGVIAPYIVGTLLDIVGANAKDQWNLIFYITTVCYVVGIVVFLIFGTDQQQEWDKMNDSQVEIEKNNEEKI